MELGPIFALGIWQLEWRGLRFSSQAWVREDGTQRWINVGDPHSTKFHSEFAFQVSVIPNFGGRSTAGIVLTSEMDFFCIEMLIYVKFLVEHSFIRYFHKSFLNLLTMFDVSLSNTLYEKILSSLVFVILSYIWEI